MVHLIVEKWVLIVLRVQEFQSFEPYNEDPNFRRQSHYSYYYQLLKHEKAIKTIWAVSSIYSSWQTLMIIKFGNDSEIRMTLELFRWLICSHFSNKFLIDVYLPAAAFGIFEAMEELAGN